MITIEQVMKWKPCYSEQKILSLSGGRREMTPREIADMETVSVEDRIWLLGRREVVGEPALAEWACDCAEHVLPIWESWAREYSPEHLRAPRVAIEVKRRHLRETATDEELTAAGAAAWTARAAAWTAGAAARAARAAAWTARAAAWTARAAAWTAAARAARAAAGTAAAGTAAAWTAWDDEEAWQLEQLKKYLQEKGE